MDNTTIRSGRKKTKKNKNRNNSISSSSILSPTFSPSNSQSKSSTTSVKELISPIQQENASYTPTTVLPDITISSEQRSKIISPASPIDDFNLKELSINLSLPPTLDAENYHNIIYKACDNVIDLISNNSTRRGDLVQKIKEEMIKLRLHTTSYFGHLQKLQGTIEEKDKIISQLLVNTPTSKQPALFSEVLQTSKKEKVIIVESTTDEDIDIQNFLSKKPLENSPKPTDIISLKRNKKFLIKHNTTKKAEEFFQNLKSFNDENMKISLSTPKNNKVILYHVPNEVSEDDLKKEILREEELQDSEFDVIKHIKSSESTRHIVLATEKDSYDKLLRRGRILLNFRSIRVHKYITLKRCFKCQHYGHYSSNCTQKEYCGKCAQEHDTRTCDTQNFKCVNCNGLHPSYSTLCPKYKEWKHKHYGRAF